MPIGRAQALKTSETRPTFQAHTFWIVKNEKPLDLLVFCRLGKTMKKFTVNSKCYNEHHPTCNILMSTHLIASKLLYLLMDWETFN